jgi:hypothetical protein
MVLPKPIPPICFLSQTYLVSSTQVSGIDEYVCTHPTVGTKFPVSVSKLQNGKFVVVASGQGVATYNCHGSAENEFEVLGVDFNAFCG